MALSYVTYTGDGANTDFNVTFQYIEKTHVHVYIDGTEDEDLIWLSDSQVRMTNAPANGAVVKVARVTPSATRIVDFQNGSTLNGNTDLDVDSDQMFYLIQEAYDRSVTSPSEIVTTVDITDGAVTNDKLADMPTLTIKGRLLAGTGVPQNLTQAQARDVLDLEPDGSTLEINSGNLRIKSAGVGAAQIGAATITGQTALSAPAKDDLLVVSDTSVAGALKKITWEDSLKVINGLTADSTPDGAADYVVSYDASAGSAKKVLLGDVAPDASSSVKGKIQLATEAEVDAGSNAVKAITPNTAKYHPGVAKAYCHADVSEVLTGNYGVTSVHATGGHRVITWATAFANANYVVLVTPTKSSGTPTLPFIISKTTTTCTLMDTLSGNDGYDIVAFGELP